MATILIQIDEVTSSLVAVLAEAGHRVIDAQSGVDAFDQVIAGQPDVVILPDGAELEDGRGLLSALRPLTNAAIIVVGMEGAASNPLVLLQGADLYVTHPVEPSQIRSRLRSILRRKSQRGRSTG